MRNAQAPRIRRAIREPGKSCVLMLAETFGRTFKKLQTMPETSTNQRPPLPLADGRSATSLEELLALRYRAPQLPMSARARQARSGGHASHLRARGVDYAESRVYLPGDDIRAMDWRVTARTGKPHTKLFREERERSLLLVLDINPTMRFGTRVRFKSVQALRAAALAAWMAVRVGDRVGALAFGRAQAFAKPRGGPRGALALLGALLRWDATADGGEESLSQGLRRCLHRVPSGSRVLLLSDGLSCDAAARPVLLRLRQHAEVMALGVADALELAAPAAGVYSFDVDDQRAPMDLTSTGARAAFQQALGHGQRDLAELCRRCAVPWQLIDTRADPVAALTVLLGRSQGLRR